MKATENDVAILAMKPQWIGGQFQSAHPTHPGGSDLPKVDRPPSYDVGSVHLLILSEKS